MFKAILRLIVFHIFCRRLVCSNVIFSDLSRSHFGSCVRDLLTFLFTSVDCAIRSQVYLSVLPNVWFLTFLIRNDFMADLVFSMYYDNLSRWVTSKNENVSNLASKNINCKTLPFNFSEADCYLYSPCWLLSLLSMSVIILQRWNPLGDPLRYPGTKFRPRVLHWLLSIVFDILTRCSRGVCAIDPAIPIFTRSSLVQVKNIEKIPQSSIPIPQSSL